MRIGFDFDNTISIDGEENVTVTTLIRTLSSHNELYLVSQCEREVEQEIGWWLVQRELHKHLDWRYYFVRDTRGKWPVVRALGLQMFYDDSLDVLQRFSKAVHRIHVQHNKLTLVE